MTKDNVYRQGGQPGQNQKPGNPGRQDQRLGQDDKKRKGKDGMPEREQQGGRSSQGERQ